MTLLIVFGILMGGALFGLLSPMVYRIYMFVSFGIAYAFLLLIGVFVYGFRWLIYPITRIKPNFVPDPSESSANESPEEA